MLKISTEEILNKTDGKLVQGENIIINKISIDSRTIKKGEFFIAIPGENFDGHDHVVEAYRKKAIGAMVDITKLTAVKIIFKKKGYDDLPEDFLIIKVENTLRSMGLIAAFYRQRYNVKTIAVTGSNGKTTTKELIYNFLLTKYKKNEILKTEKNYNNEVGVPFTIFKLNPQIKVFVAELGINHIGEMQRLAFMVDPDYGVITNIGETHLEFLKNDRIVAKAKAELLPFIKNTLVFNFDDRYYTYFLNFAECRVEGFSLNKGEEFTDINSFDECMNLGLKGFNLVYKGEKIEYNLVGEHNLSNLLCALTAVKFFNISVKKIKKVVRKFRALEDRGNIKKLKNLTIFYDAYNANPSSNKAMLYFIGQLDFKNHLAVLGDMMELGKKAMKHHTEVLHYANSCDFNKVYLYGKYYSRVYRERMDDRSGLKPMNEFKAIAGELKQWAARPEKTVVLVKGSRKMEMEKLLKLLK